MSRELKLKTLQTQGPLGILSFWITLLLLGISLSAAIFAIYWMALSGSSLWLSAISASLLVTNLFLMLLAFACIALHILDILDITFLFDGFPRQLLTVVSFLSQLLCVILMTLSTEVQAEEDYARLWDFIRRNGEDSRVVAFVAEHPTDYSVHSYVEARTTNLYGAIATFFGLWLTATFAFLVCAHGLDGGSRQNGVPGQELRPLTPVQREGSERLRRSGGMESPRGEVDGRRSGRSGRETHEGDEEPLRSGQGTREELGAEAQGDPESPQRKAQRRGANPDSSEGFD
jgi:hypothetical protein